MGFETTKAQIVYGINSMMEKVGCHSLEWGFEAYEELPRFIAPNGVEHGIVFLDKSNPQKEVLLISSKPIVCKEEKCTPNFYNPTDFRRLKDLENIFIAVFEKLYTKENFSTDNPITLLKSYAEEYNSLCK